MSVEILVVRFINAQQTTLLGSDEDQAWSDLCCEFDELPRSFQVYQLFELVSCGWESGARFRTRKLAPKKVLAYLNKLVSGGWIDADEYHKAYGAAFRLLEKNRALIEGADSIQVEISELSQSGLLNGS